METIWWTISLVLMFLGLIGAVFPVVPDSLFILAGAFLHHFTVRPAHAVGWWTLGVLTGLCILAHVVDYTAGAMGARKFGASKWGALGGFVGAIVGLSFFPVGLFLGTGNARRLGHASRHDGGHAGKSGHRSDDGRNIPLANPASSVVGCRRKDR